MTDVPAGWLAAAAVALVVVAGMLAAAEAALERLTRAETARLAAEGRRGAVAARALVSDPAPTVTVSTFLRVGAETTAAVCTTLALTSVVTSWLVVLAASSAVMVVVVFVVVGVGPRTLGRQHAEAVVLGTAPLLGVLTRLLRPVARVMVALGNALTPGRGYRYGPFASEDELREMVDLASESAVIEAGERQMIHSVFELGDTLVHEVMVPRTDMVTTVRGTTLHKAMSLFLRSGFSRVPVVGESVDDLLGMLYLKDVARRVHDAPASASSSVVEGVMRTPVFVPESKPVDALLREMQRDSNHVAVVVDEYGGTAGLVTIEDLLEEIVGEIADEYDREAPDVEHLEGDTYRVSSRLPIDELGDLFGIEIEDDEVDSVGGLLAKTLGKVPIPGARASVAGLELVAERQEGRRNRITTVLVRPEEAATARPRRAVGPVGGSAP